MEHDWGAIGMAALALFISVTDGICRRRSRRHGNYIPRTSDMSHASPPPKPKK